MLQSLTELQLTDRAYEARQKLVRLEKRVADLTRERDELMTHLVARFLPELTKATFKAMTESFPDFLSAQRAQTFKEHSKFFFGLFTPGGYDHALALMQAQFRAHLDSCGRFEREDAELGRLTRQAAALRTELTDIEREKVARLTRAAATRMHGVTPAATPQAPRPAPTTTRAPQRQVVREEVVVVDDGDDGLMPFAVAAALSNSRNDYPAPVIATDDRLGCFS